MEKDKMSKEQRLSVTLSRQLTLKCVQENGAAGQRDGLTEGWMDMRRANKAQWYLTAESRWQIRVCGCSLQKSFSSLYVGKKRCDKIGGVEYHHKSPKPQREERQKSGFNSQYFVPIFTLGTYTAGDRLGDLFHVDLLRLAEQSSG